MNTKPRIRKGLTLGIILLCIWLSVVFSINAQMLTPNNAISPGGSSTMNVDPGTLSGYVTDAARHPIEGAKVKVSFHNTSRENFSDTMGYYHVTDIPICYCLKNATCSKEGYTPEWALLSIYENTTQDFMLTPTGHWLYVGGTGPGNYSTIQNAINASTDGDTVFVYAGTYYEHIRVFRAIRLLGQAMNTTIIDGQYAGTVVLLNATVTISGFTLQHSGKIYGSEAGIQTKNQPDMSYIITVTGNRIQDNNIGVFIQHSGNHRIIGNTFTHNDKGIALFISQDCSITNNNFINNTIQGSFQYFILLQKHPRNNWDGNYWDDWHSMLPKPIKGTKEWILFALRPGAVYTIPFKWVNFDWHPTKQPYEIPFIEV